MSVTTYQQWIEQATQNLSRISDSAKLDARLLLCHGLSIPLSRLLSWPETELSPENLDHLNSLLSRRLDGMPVAYILGNAEFWGINLKVSEAVLVPRPETETLVEVALDKLGSERDQLTLLDLGTGSGAIAIALASELPTAKVTAVDASAEALEIARYNVESLQLNNVTCIHSNWFNSVPTQNRFDMIVSNPPYVAENDPHLDDLRYEPDMALTAKDCGIADIRHIIENGYGYLKEEGFILIEHGFEQGEEVRQLFIKNSFVDVSTIKDLAGNDRVTLGKYMNG